MQYYSLEKTLSKKVALLNTAIFIILLFILNIVMSIWLEHEFDESLEAKANVLVTLMKDNPNGLDFDFADEFMPEFDDEVEPEYFQIWLDENEVFERSNSLREQDLPKSEASAIGQSIQDLVLIDGRVGRMIEVVFLPQIPEDKDRTPEKLINQKLITLVLAKERGELNLLINTIQSVSIISALVIIFMIHFLVRHTVRKSLIPLHELKLQIQRLDANNLKQRLNISRTPIELLEVIEQFNHLLSRLETSFFREQRFSSDVAHELRTPISEMRSMSEVALKWPNDIALANKFYSGVLESSIQMQTLVNNLLALARCEEGDITLDIKSFNLFELINTCIEHYKAQAEKNSINMINEIDMGLTIKTSSIEFEQIVNNLLSNAVRYSISASDILITAITEHDDINLVVSNKTDQLEESDLAFVFDRLWRKNIARSSSNNSGLGLSLVKAYAGILELEITPRLTNNELCIVIGHIKQ